MSTRMHLFSGALLAGALVFGGCVHPRTEIVLRMRTDMTQGPSAELTAVHVRVTRDGESTARFDHVFVLGTGDSPTMLPNELGLVADGHNDAHLTVDVDALHGDAVMVSRHAHVAYVPEQTLLLDLFLAKRCSDPASPSCPEGQSCGATACEPDERPTLPAFTASDGGEVDDTVTAFDASTDTNSDVRVDAPRDTPRDAPCTAVCHSECTDLSTDAHNCGACGHDCTLLPNATDSAMCAAGVCGFPAGACAAGFADCDSRPDTGCEADLSQPANCGRCANACVAPSPYCVGSNGTFTCSNQCMSATPVQCGALCVDTATDPVNCGGCDHVCTGAANATPTCAGSVCGFRCNMDFHLCAAACVSDTAITSCGTSCSPCSPPASHGRATCDGTACGISCDPGYMPAGNDCVTAPPIPAPRPLGPASTGIVTTLRPTFRWASTAGTDGARVEVCRDRACTTVVGTVEAGGGATSVTLDTALPVAGSRVYYWRLYGKLAGATGVTPSVVWSFTARGRATAVDTSWGAVPDVNGDGFADLLVGTRSDAVVVYDGASGTLGGTAAQQLMGTAGSGFGASLAAAGDVNGDGFTDVIVGAPTAGIVSVFHGSATGLASAPAITIDGPTGSDFGASVAGAGDVNGDGYADVIVGASTVASAFVYYGSATGIVTTSVSTLSSATGSRFGASVAGAGDVNGDGRTDVVVGAPGANMAYVFHGSAPSLPSAVSATSASATLTGSAATDFGTAVSSADDTNGDGYADVIVGAPLESAAYVYAGSATGVATAFSGALRKPTPSGSGPNMFGASVASAGDGNNDGYADVIVGAPGVAGMAGISIAYVFHGGASGLARTAVGSATSHNRSFSTTLTTSRLGAAVMGAGDLTGDGFDDVTVGAPGNLNSVYVYFGGAAGFPASTSMTLVGSGVSGFGTWLAARVPAHHRSRLLLALRTR